MKVSWVDANGLKIDEPSFPRELEYLTLARVLIARGRGDPEGPYFGHALRLIGCSRRQRVGHGWSREREVLTLGEVLRLCLGCSN